MALAPASGHQTDDLFGFGLIGIVGEDRVDAALGEAKHGVAAEPAAAAGDDGDLSL